MISIAPEILFMAGMNTGPSKIKICTLIPINKHAHTHTHIYTGPDIKEVRGGLAEMSLYRPCSATRDKQPNKTFKNLGYWHA